MSKEKPTLEEAMAELRRTKGEHPKYGRKLFAMNHEVVFLMSEKLSAANDEIRDLKQLVRQLEDKIDDRTD